MRTNYRTLCLLLGATTFATSLNAGPTRRQVVTLKQPSGVTFQAKFVGDEFGSFYVDLAGQRLRRDSLGYWRPMSAEQATEAHAQIMKRRTDRAADNAAASAPTGETRAMDLDAATRSKANLTFGEHKMLTLLIQFPDLQFQQSSLDHFDDMFNGTDFTYQGATGSARQYFRDNSMEQYDPTFDIVGPVTLTQNYAYYGGNDKDGSDKNARSAIIEGIRLAINQGLITDLSPYDNDGDGTVDLVYVIYAGYSEADYDDEEEGADYIWPHQWVIPTTQNGVATGKTRCYKYACSSELMKVNKMDYLDGIGSICHEFSHGLGLPDFYNTGSETGCYGMDRWSHMDQGCYGNNGHTPVNFTAYERQALGWMQCETLPTSGDVVLPRLATSNKAYVYYNPANPNEAFFFENHQSEGWDAYYDYSSKVSLHGLMITHLDYSDKAWEANTVNNTPTHQRYTMVPADGALFSYDKVGSSKTQYSKFLTSFRNDIWPGYTSKNTSFSAETYPSATFFTGDSATFVLTNIAEDEEGNITFHIEPNPNLVSSNNSGATGIEDLTTDPWTGRFVDVYDLAGRRVLSGVESQALWQQHLPAGYYMVHDGKTSRKVYLK
jgi:M6 family metalloprotease-like protein